MKIKLFMMDIEEKKGEAYISFSTKAQEEKLLQAFKDDKWIDVKIQ